MIYVVQQGDHLAGIAAKFGFQDFHTIYDDPDNADLKQKRPDPNQLFPGDEVNIPDKQPKVLDVATTQSHRFTLKRQTLKLRLKMLDFRGRPIKSAELSFDVGGRNEQLTTDGNGAIETVIDPRDANGTVHVTDYEARVQIGGLDPIETQSGRIARLVNMGYVQDPIDEDDVALGVSEFQADNSLDVTGEFDDATKSQLQQIYGC